MLLGDAAENDSFLTHDSMKYLDLSHLSIISNGLLIGETIENPLDVLYQYELDFDSDSPENHIGWGVT